MFGLLICIQMVFGSIIAASLMTDLSHKELAKKANQGTNIIVIRDTKKNTSGSKEDIEISNTVPKMKKELETIFNSDKETSATPYSKESVDIVETGKELIKKIDSLEKLKAEKTKNILENEILVESAKLKKITNLKKEEITEKEAEKQPLNPIKKLSDLLFKSSIVTKSEILTKEDAAILIENNDKIKNIALQLQKIFDSNENILNKFIVGNKNGVETPVEEKPKDFLKYRVIEITEKKKKT